MSCERTLLGLRVRVTRLERLELGLHHRTQTRVLRYRPSNELPGELRMARFIGSDLPKYRSNRLILTVSRALRSLKSGYRFAHAALDDCHLHDRFERVVAQGPRHIQRSRSDVVPSILACERKAVSRVLGLIDHRLIRLLDQLNGGTHREQLQRESSKRCD